MKIAISKEVKTAVLVLLSIGMLIWGYTFLNGKNIFSSSRTFFVEYENVEGLSTASSVTINGMVVGKVHHISLKGQGKLLVEILMSDDVDIPISSKAVILVQCPNPPNIVADGVAKLFRIPIALFSQIDLKYPLLSQII